MTFKVHLDIYEQTVVVVLNKDIKEGAKTCERLAKRRIKAGDKYFDGISALTWDADPHTIYMMLTDKDPSVIAHECIHASWFVAKRVGLSFKKDDEAQTYMVQYLMEQILKKLK